MYKLRPQDGVQQAILVTSSNEHMSPHHHLLPNHMSPLHSPGTPPHCSQPYLLGSTSPPVSAVMFRSPSQIIYTAAAANSEKQLINSKDIYEALPYPADSYHVPISIPTCQVVYHVPRSSMSSEQPRHESVQYSDTMSDQSDSSSSLRPSSKSRPKAARQSRTREKADIQSPYQHSTEPSHKNIMNASFQANSLKRQVYVNNSFVSKLKPEDANSTAGLIRPPTTKKREITSAFAPLLANQKESEVWQAFLMKFFNALL